MTSPRHGFWTSIRPSYFNTLELLYRLIFCFYAVLTTFTSIYNYFKLGDMIHIISERSEIATRVRKTFVIVFRLEGFMESNLNKSFPSYLFRIMDWLNSLIEGFEYQSTIYCCKRSINIKIIDLWGHILRRNAWNGLQRDWSICDGFFLHLRCFIELSPIQYYGLEPPPTVYRNKFNLTYSF